jgi:SAM-dependent methyltransferase
VSRALAAEQVKAFYDHFGSKQDSQSFYENAAIDDLIAHSAFPSASRVFEFGCGTGRVAERILANELAPDARYEGVDISSTMIEIASSRLRRFGERAQVRRVDARSPFAGIETRPDRILTTYVIDLLSSEDAANFVDDCARMLQPGGRLCLASLTFGTTPLSRAVSAGWRTLFRLSPRIVGGCRPIHLLPLFDAACWDVVHHRVVTSFGIASEVVVAVTRSSSGQ